jgi:hypothetical protein
MKSPAPKERKRIAPGLSPGLGADEERALKERHISLSNNVTIISDPQNARL